MPSTLFLCGGPCHLFSFKQGSGDLIFLWEECVIQLWKTCFLLYPHIVNIKIQSLNIFSKNYTVPLLRLEIGVCYTGIHLGAAKSNPFKANRPFTVSVVWKSGFKFINGVHRKLSACAGLLHPTTTSKKSLFYHTKTFNPTTMSWASRWNDTCRQWVRVEEEVRTSDKFASPLSWKFQESCAWVEYLEDCYGQSLREHSGKGCCKSIVLCMFVCACVCVCVCVCV